MKKTTIYSLLLTSLTLNQAVLADEIIAPAEDQPGIVSPTEPSQPVIPTTPVTVAPVEPTTSDTATPKEAEETKPEQPTEPVTPVQPGQPTDPVRPLPEQPTQPKTPESPTEPSQPKEVEQSSQTSQTPAATNPSAPVTPIVRSSASTDPAGDQPIIDAPSSSEKPAEEVVISPKNQIQSSKTVEKTTEQKEGEQTLDRLPDTGTADSSFLSFLGAAALGLVGLVLHKKQKKNGSI